MSTCPKPSFDKFTNPCREEVRAQQISLSQTTYDCHAQQHRLACNAMALSLSVWFILAIAAAATALFIRRCVPFLPLPHLQGGANS